jgi:hypothetical protein
MPFPTNLCLIYAASVASFDSVRETRTRLKPLEASCNAYSLPRPSDAPVTTAHVPGFPYFRSYQSRNVSGFGLCMARERNSKTHVGSRENEAEDELEVAPELEGKGEGADTSKSPQDWLRYTLQDLSDGIHDEIRWLASYACTYWRCGLRIEGVGFTSFQSQ